MGKVSIGLRGWRFNEADIFTENGEFRPLEEMPREPRHRLMRLTVLSGNPCNACWLIHGDENLESCNVAEVVYGEPLSEVLLCSDHERDFLYWYQEAGGQAHRGEETFQDAFHEWFADGNRAPEWFEGIDHVETDPENLPDPPPPEQVAPEPPENEHRVDLRDVDLDMDYPG